MILLQGFLVRPIVSLTKNPSRNPFNVIWMSRKIGPKSSIILLGVRLENEEISMSHFAVFNTIDCKQRGCREESQTRYGEHGAGRQPI